jgi:hypothetical protein
LLVLLFAAASLQTLVAISHRGYRWSVTALVVMASVLTLYALTTVLHAKLLQNRMDSTGERAATRKIYFYEGKGHGFFDAPTVCTRLEKFLLQLQTADGSAR